MGYGCSLEINEILHYYIFEQAKRIALNFPTQFQSRLLLVSKFFQNKFSKGYFINPSFIQQWKAYVNYDSAKQILDNHTELIFESDYKSVGEKAVNLLKDTVQWSINCHSKPQRLSCSDWNMIFGQNKMAKVNDDEILNYFVDEETYCALRGNYCENNWEFVQSFNHSSLNYYLKTSFFIYQLGNKDSLRLIYKTNSNKLINLTLNFQHKS